MEPNSGIVSWQKKFGVNFNSIPDKTWRKLIKTFECGEMAAFADGVDWLNAIYYQNRASDIKKRLIELASSSYDERTKWARCDRIREEFKSIYNDAVANWANVMEDKIRQITDDTELVFAHDWLMGFMPGCPNRQVWQYAKNAVKNRLEGVFWEQKMLLDGADERYLVLSDHLTWLLDDSMFE